jgi:hypothetical protein
LPATGILLSTDGPTTAWSKVVGARRMSAGDRPSAGDGEHLRRVDSRPECPTLSEATLASVARALKEGQIEWARSRGSLAADVVLDVPQELAKPASGAPRITSAAGR